MILACHNIEKYFGDKCLIKGGGFHVNAYEKAALIGANGAGKSTIFKMIVGEEHADSGQISIAKGTRVGYLAQHQTQNTDRTIYETVQEARRETIELEKKIRQLEKQIPELGDAKLNDALDEYHRLTVSFEDQGGYAIESEITGILHGLGFSRDDYTRTLDTLSGGQKTRVALAALLLSKPDLLLLDEPTNHLDLASVTWLEEYISQYKGSVLVISHDRYFLNRFVTKVIEIDNGNILSFEGNYRDFSEKKQQLVAARQKEYINRQREIEHQRAVIEKLRSFNREKSIRRAESREKMLEKLSPIGEDPFSKSADMRLSLTPSVTSGQDVMTIRDLSKSFDDLSLFEHVDLDIRRGERIAVIGENGTGKTTLLKIINEIVAPDEGYIRLGANVQIGYYDQEHHILDHTKTLFQEISDTFPHMTETAIRNTLAAFCFFGDDVFQTVGLLSGGEKGRLSLAKLMLSEANLLILDEPTNHLDIDSKEILEHALQCYEGTVLYVSHDRYFINETATRILDLTNRQFVSYPGNYDYYMEKRGERSDSSAGSIFRTSPRTVPMQNPAQATEKTADSENKLSWQEQKEWQARLRKYKNDMEKTELQIQQCEEENESLDAQLATEEVYADPEKCRICMQQKQDVESRLQELYTLWESLGEKIAEMEQEPPL